MIKYNKIIQTTINKLKLSICLNILIISNL